MHLKPVPGGHGASPGDESYSGAPVVGDAHICPAGGTTDQLGARDGIGELRCLTGVGDLVGPASSSRLPLHLAEHRRAGGIGGDGVCKLVGLPDV